jgi:hypothetical protein
VQVITNNNTLPDVYAYSDEAALTSPEKSDYTPSPITKINGEDVLPWLNSYASQNGHSQDADANYNQVFLDIPQVAYQGIAGDLFVSSRYYQGNDTVLSFANETRRSVITMAQYLSTETLEGLTDGSSFFQKFCTNNLTGTLLGQATSTSDSLTTPSNTTQVPYEPVSTTGVSPPHPAYPSPFIASSDKSISGYLSESKQDLAVLSIPSFSTSSYTDFENIVRQLLATANANNRTKLVIDLCGNGGGLVFLAHDLFGQLFPTSTR